MQLSDLEIKGTCSVMGQVLTGKQVIYGVAVTQNSLGVGTGNVLEKSVGLVLSLLPRPWPYASYVSGVSKCNSVT